MWGRREPCWCSGAVRARLGHHERASDQAGESTPRHVSPDETILSWHTPPYPFFSSLVSDAVAIPLHPLVRYVTDAAVDIFGRG